MKKKILITGSTGYLGSHLVDSLFDEYDLVLLKRAHSNTGRINAVLENVLALNTDGLDLGTLFQQHNFSGVIHCATNYGRQGEDLDVMINANLMMPLRLLKHASENNVQFFINTDTILDRTLNYYSLSKAQFRDWLLFFSAKIKIVNLQLEHFYGKGDDSSKFVTKIIRDLALDDPGKLDLTLGEQKRRFIYIDDVVLAYKIVLDKISEMDPGINSIQVGSKTQISIKDFVILTKELCHNTKTRLNFGALPYRNNEAMEVTVDLSKLEKLGWSEQTTLRQGLEQTIAFEMERLKSLREEKTP